MKLLQVVLCVVLALLSPEETLGRFTYDEEYKRLTYYHSEELVFSKTLYPVGGFNADEDAKILFKAMEGFGTNETAIRYVLPYRGMEQRQNIAQAYKRLYNRKLIEDLYDELSGDFRQVILSLLYELGEFYASEMHSALTNMFYTAEVDIVEILLSLSNEGIQSVQFYYLFLVSSTKSNLRNDVATHLSGRFRMLIQGLIKADRPETTAVDETQVQADTQAMIDNDWSDVTDIIPIFTSRSFTHLQKVFEKYENETGKSIEHAFNHLKEGNYKMGMLAIVRRAKSRIDFLAYQLYCQAGVNSLIRIVVGRCEIDLRAILKSHDMVHSRGKTLAQYLTMKYTIMNSDYLNTILKLSSKI